jgi:hypothetical protein
MEKDLTAKTVDGNHPRCFSEIVQKKLFEAIQ